uniref:hypothetical protein n=1 Tax=Streptomyces recifensis TaxID=67355 RepID=UPI001122658C
PVRGADGTLTLEVWAPARGRAGGGLVVPDTGEVERYAARWDGSCVVVSHEAGGGPVEPSRPVRVRGLGGAAPGQ